MMNTYYKDRLGANECLAYEDLCRGIADHKKEINIRYTDDLGGVLKAINYDHPEFFYVNWLDRAYYSEGCGRMYVSLSYIYKEKEVAYLQAKMKEIAKNIAGISTFGKALCIHDWFVENIKYDHAGLEQVIRSPGMFSAAGPLSSQKAVCEGISKLACYIMREKGIDSAVIIGRSQDGTPHAWNMLNIDGKDVFADITYDIGLSADGIVRRNYFLLSRSEISKDHVFE